jgi:phosphatidylglycerophosphate synthase
MLCLCVVLILIGTNPNYNNGIIVTAGLSVLAAVCVWNGIDYFTQKKKHLGVLMLTAALAIFYMAFKMFIEPMLG